MPNEFVAADVPDDICETIATAAATNAMHATRWYGMVGARDTVVNRVLTPAAAASAAVAFTGKTAGRFAHARRGRRKSADTENVSRHAHGSPRARDVGNINTTETTRANSPVDVFFHFYYYILPTTTKNIMSCIMQFIGWTD